MTDAATLATIAALMHFRIPEISVTDGIVERLHSAEESPPLPLSLHHIPLSITFALFSIISEGEANDSQGSAYSTSTGEMENSSSGKNQEFAMGEGLTQEEIDCNVLIALDPTDKEELLMDGSMSIVCNEHQEVCSLHKFGNPGLTPALLRQCLQQVVIRIV